MHTDERELAELRSMTPDDVKYLIIAFLFMLAFDGLGYVPLSDGIGGTRWKWVMYTLILVASIISMVIEEKKRKQIRS